MSIKIPRQIAWTFWSPRHFLAYYWHSSASTTICHIIVLLPDLCQKFTNKTFIKISCMIELGDEAIFTYEHDSILSATSWSYILATSLSLVLCYFLTDRNLHKRVHNHSVQAWETGKYSSPPPNWSKQNFYSSAYSLYSLNRACSYCTFRSFVCSLYLLWELSFLYHSVCVSVCMCIAIQCSWNGAVVLLESLKWPKLVTV